MEKCLFTYNPQSGKGKIVKNENLIVKMLNEKYEVNVVRSEYAGHIGEIILEQGENFDLIVVAGGDGTLNEAINSIARLNKKVKLGYIPTGTVNDVAHSLKIPKNIKKAVNIILNGQEFQHDIFKMNDHYGIYVCCSGLFTESSYATNQNNGVKKIFTSKSINLSLKYQGGKFKGNFAIMLIINSHSVAGFKINPKAILNDGLVDVVLIKSKKEKINFSAVLRVAKLFLFGIPKKSSKNVTVLHLDKFEVETSTGTIINLDGERIGDGSFSFETIKEGVNILIPK